MPDKHGKKPDDGDANPMPAEAFREWRKRLGLKQKDAADLLGLKKRMIQYYETGSRSGKHVSIPKSIRLACYALEVGVGDYDGRNILGDASVSAGVHRMGAHHLSAAQVMLNERVPNQGVSNDGQSPPPLPLTTNDSD
ncbi:MAG: helix-turn-helix transcriptional regulator [Hyphomicrobiales bacterium]|jgi:transcriptional regulator with XRE-family HTH domain